MTSCELKLRLKFLGLKLMAFSTGIEFCYILQSAFPISSMPYLTEKLYIIIMATKRSCIIERDQGITDDSI